MDMVSTLTDEKNADPEKIKRSLDEAVKKLDQEKSSSESWGSAVTSNRERWESLKASIKERQHALKELVREKKTGTIGQEEFETKYRKIQDELTELEFQVYNMRLGTDIKM